MDPNANLKEQRELAQELVEVDIPDERDIDAMDVLIVKTNRLAELVSSLDEWLKSGGFLPSDWAK